MAHIKWVVGWLILIIFEPAFAVGDSADYSTGKIFSSTTNNKINFIGSLLDSTLSITTSTTNDVSLDKVFSEKYISPTITTCNDPTGGSAVLQGLCSYNYTISKGIRCYNNVATAPGCNIFSGGSLKAP